MNTAPPIALDPAARLRADVLIELDIALTHAVDEHGAALAAADRAKDSLQAQVDRVVARVRLNTVLGVRRRLLAVLEEVS